MGIEAPTQEELEAEETRAAQVDASLRAAGQPTDLPVAADYFGFEEYHQVLLPDGVSYIQHKTLTEGDRRKYMDKVNKEVRLQKSTGDAIVRLQQGAERLSLLEAAITGWNLQRQGQPLPFSKDSPGSNLSQFLNMADPKVVDLIHKDIQEKNPWLLADVTIEEIDRQIDELTELRATKVKEKEGKDS